MAVKTYLQAISDGLRSEMQRDKRVFIIGEDVGVYGGAFKVTQGFQEEFGPWRVIDAPLSETAIVGGCTGAAIMGMRPVAEMQFADFISCAWDHLVTVAAKQRYRAGTPVPITVRLPSGGGFSGGPFHSQNPESSFAHIPGLKVVCPATPADAKGLLIEAIHDPNPVLYFEHKHLYRRIKDDVPDERYTVPFGDERLTIEQPLPVALRHVAVVAEKAGEMRLSSPQVRDQQDMPANGKTYIAGRGPGIDANQTLTLNFTGLPHHSTWPRDIALGLAVLILAGGAWSAFKGANKRAGIENRRRNLETRRDGLFDELTALEGGHRQGLVDPERISAAVEESGFTGPLADYVVTYSALAGEDAAEKAWTTATGLSEDAIDDGSSRASMLAFIASAQAHPPRS